MAVKTGVSGLAAYIKDSFARKQKENGAPVRGVISGSSVLINGMYYPYTMASEAASSEGSYVWCFLNEAKTLAVVVGS